MRRANPADLAASFTLIVRSSSNADAALAGQGPDAQASLPRRRICDGSWRENSIRTGRHDCSYLHLRLSQATSLSWRSW